MLANDMDTQYSMIVKLPDLLMFRPSLFPAIGYPAGRIAAQTRRTGGKPRLSGNLTPTDRG